MKQHINTTDWYSIEYEKQIKLCDILKIDINLTVMFQHQFLPKITIGKMIEILEKETTSIDINRSFTSEEIWTLIIGFGMGGVEFFEKELCDALWKAVKEVL